MDDAREEINAETPVEAAQPFTFEDFGFCEEIMQGIREAGFTEPTPIQKKAIPSVMEGHDLIGQALTGTGKTAAFGLPVMNNIVGKSGLSFLVLVPTRELAAQVSAELFRLGRHANIHTAAFTGGQSYSRQEKLLAMGVDALVATPGRLIDLIESGHFNDINPEYIVVDEADEMLDMGFLEDVKKIFDSFPGPRHTMLFSATMPRPVVELAEKILVNPVKITTQVAETANNDIEQLFFVIEDRERIDAIVRLIDAENVAKAIIFCRTKEETDALNILLGGRGYNVNCLHGDMEQAQRSRVMAAFRRGEIDILVATDVAARGLDVDDVTHVFNFHLPFDSRGYVHRIGRTGRAGKTGTAITLVTPRELRQLEAIKKSVGAQIANRLIPTRTEVTSLRLKKIFRELHDFELDMDILNQIQTLAVNQDVMVLLAKLVGKQLSGGADQGPEHIGIEGQRLTNLLAPKSKEKGGRGDRGGRGRRRFRDDDFDGEGRRSRRRHREEDGDFMRTPPEELSEFEKPVRPPRPPRPETDDFEPPRPPKRKSDDFEAPRPPRPPRHEADDFEAPRPPKRKEGRKQDKPDFRESFRRKDSEDRKQGKFRDEKPRRKREDSERGFASPGKRFDRGGESSGDFRSFRKESGKRGFDGDSAGFQRKSSGAKRDKSPSFNRHDVKSRERKGKGGQDKSWYLS